MSKRKKIATKSKQYAKALMPAKVLQAQLHKRVFMQFAEKIGLVYFGYVNQRSDEHRLVRGLTVSARHRDSNYCVGSFKGYDISLVERTDTIRFPGKPSKTHNWIIMTFDLHIPEGVPHVFIGLHTHSETFYSHLFTKFTNMVKAPLGTFGAHDPLFINKYAMYTEPAHIVAAEQLFSRDITAEIAKHFGSFTVELFDDSLYIYAEHQRPTGVLLERMLKCGLWLAESLDAKSQKRH